MEDTPIEDDDVIKMPRMEVKNFWGWFFLLTAAIVAIGFVSYQIGFSQGAGDALTYCGGKLNEVKEACWCLV